MYTYIFQFYMTEITRSRLLFLLSKDNFCTATYPYLSTHSVLFSSKYIFFSWIHKLLCHTKVSVQIHSLETRINF